MTMPRPAPSLAYWDRKAFALRVRRGACRCRLHAGRRRCHTAGQWVGRESHVAQRRCASGHAERGGWLCPQPLMRNKAGLWRVWPMPAVREALPQSRGKACAGSLRAGGNVRTRGRSWPAPSTRDKASHAKSGRILLVKRLPPPYPECERRRTGEPSCRQACRV